MQAKGILGEVAAARSVVVLTPQSIAMESCCCSCLVSQRFTATATAASPMPILLIDRSATASRETRCWQMRTTRRATACMRMHRCTEVTTVVFLQVATLWCLTGGLTSLVGPVVKENRWAHWCWPYRTELNAEISSCSSKDIKPYLVRLKILKFFKISYHIKFFIYV